MTNFQVYRKTLPFSFITFGVSIISLLIVGGLAVGGFAIANAREASMGLVGLLIGVVLGIIIAVLINIFILNRVQAAQIAMMTKGVTEDKLPDHTVSEGFKEIKGRFGKITAFYFITSAIKSTINQVNRSINKIGTAIGGQVGNSVTSAVDSAIQILVSYLCDCCMGWILFRTDINSFRAGCEGVAIFFKHGKTLIRNVGRIFGMGLASLVLIGGAFFGISYLILSRFPAMFTVLSEEIMEAAARGDVEVPEFMYNPSILMIVICAVIALILFSIIHSVLIRPFVLTGVLRNFMAAGIADIPTEADFAELEKRSPKFTKLLNKAE